MSTTRLASQKQAFEAFIDAWRNLSIDDIVKLRTPDCIQESIPKDSLQMPDQTNDEWLAALRPAFGTLSNFKADVHAVIHDAEASRSVVYANTSADATWGDYRNTHILIFTWNEDGTKMTRIEDMMDSAGMLKRMAKMQAWQAEQAKASVTEKQFW